jgi:hypothetical protein
MDYGAHYEYCDKPNTTATEDTDPLYLGSDYSDDDGHRECGLGGYENCPDNPARRSKAQEDDSFEANEPDPDNTGIT